MVCRSILGWSKHLQISWHCPALLTDLAYVQLATQPVCSNLYILLSGNSKFLSEL
jgi:hypothetical protein